MAISAVVITQNSERRLAYTLASLQGFDEILVIDMDSSDSTPEIARRYGARIVNFPASGDDYNYAVRNFAIRAAHYEWVLMVRPDEVIPPNLRRHLYKFLNSPARDDESRPDGLRIPRKNHIFHKFNSTTYPDYQLRFFRKEVAHWHPGKGIQPQVNGEITAIPSNRHELAIIHLPRDVAHYLRFLNRATGRRARLADTRPITWWTLMRSCTGSFLKYYFGEAGIKYGMPGFIRACNHALESYLLFSRRYEDSVMPDFFRDLPIGGDIPLPDHTAGSHTLPDSLAMDMADTISRKNFPDFDIMAPESTNKKQE
ncbi:MAG: glycosyltransferase family 2 protein [Muribaculaceae bacterium]|nr:glycosyltransferase family 2 protein [Muribaculaceae bacterium]